MSKGSGGASGGVAASSSGQSASGVDWTKTGEGTAVLVDVFSFLSAVRETQTLPAAPPLSGSRAVMPHVTFDSRGKPILTSGTATAAAAAAAGKSTMYVVVPHKYSVRIHYRFAPLHRH